MNTLTKTLDKYEGAIDNVWHFIWWNYLPSFLPFLVCYVVFVGGVTGEWSVPGAMLCHVICTVAAGIMFIVIDFNDLRFYDELSGVYAVYLTLENCSVGKNCDKSAKKFATMFAWFTLFEIALWAVCGVVYLLFQLVASVSLVLTAVLRPIWRRQ